MCRLLEFTAHTQIQMLRFWSSLTHLPGIVEIKLTLYLITVLSSMEEDMAQVNSAEFCGWEAHTRGIGSKLLLKMGYELGKGR